MSHYDVKCKSMYSNWISLQFRMQLFNLTVIIDIYWWPMFTYSPLMFLVLECLSVIVHLSCRIDFSSTMPLLVMQEALRLDESDNSQ